MSTAKKVKYSRLTNMSQATTHKGIMVHTTRKHRKPPVQVIHAPDANAMPTCTSCPKFHAFFLSNSLNHLPAIPNPCPDFTQLPDAVPVSLPCHVPVRTHLKVLLDSAEIRAEASGRLPWDNILVTVV